MLSVAEARARILAGLVPTPAETIGLAEAAGRYAAAPVRARLDQPAADVSAMDGYALAAGTGPWRLVGSAPAGHPWPGALGADEALRLFTGSVVPQGAVSILLQENAAVEAGVVHATEPPQPGRHIRPAGQDFARGDVLVAAGQRLGPRLIGLAAAGNHPWVSVHRAPRVAILATGDEIALPGEPVPAGGVVSSNAHALAALVRAHGGLPSVLPIAGDDLAALAGAADAAAGFDLLLSSGGASVGDHDLVREGFAARGMTLDFWQVAMRPGKPLMHGRLGTLPVLGLPGNPVSCFVTALLFATPAIDRLAGGTGAPPAESVAVLGAPLPANDHRADHLRARLERAGDGTLCVTAFERQDSAQLRLLAAADALILRPPHAKAAVAGEAVPILRL